MIGEYVGKNGLLAIEICIAVVQIPVFLRGNKRQMRPVVSQCEEEGLVLVLQSLERFQRQVGLRTVVEFAVGCIERFGRTSVGPTAGVGVGILCQSPLPAPGPVPG